ncbi:O-antigen ligase family protein [Croceitalea rosinachiae]|uniref:O-antigen ligase family protein n=1 Tax=Croceitalea rosinachiae TaxID=3075596 RepID=A0ABU3A7U0_9FLAO|nr:O-antigen ligase family protein [Croceitalea sp. F388]MDT0606244.1 O-antigen ligase family protein [Croceitalea sp. F388]
MLKSKDIYFIAVLLIVFQIGPLSGFMKTGDFSALFNDIIVSAKWFNVPLSFFYFKNLFQGRYFPDLNKKIKLIISRSFGLIVFNIFLGALGFGMAFYNHGFNNPIGTKGYIYAGNELTILTLALAFIIGIYVWQKKNYKMYGAFFLFFLTLSFFITSKTIIGGTILVFMIPLICSIKYSIKKKWINLIWIAGFFGIPVLSVLMYVGITESGIIDKLENSLLRNDNNIITVILSNRNNFIEKGWDAYKNFPFEGKLFGYGQNYHLELSGHLAEIDFLSLLFASGIFGLVTLLLTIFYWHMNARNLKRNKNGYHYAKFILVFLWFLIVVANLSGHIFGSGIAGFFIGLSLSLMFFKTNNRLDA